MMRMENVYRATERNRLRKVLGDHLTKDLTFAAQKSGWPKAMESQHRNSEKEKCNMI